METVLHPLLPTAIIPTVQANIRLEDRASFHTFFASSGNIPDVETASVAAIPNPEVEDETADREDGAGEAALDSETPENLAEDDAFEMPFQTQNTDNTAAKHPSVPPELVSGSKQPTDLAGKTRQLHPKTKILGKYRINGSRRMVTRLAMTADPCCCGRRQSIFKKSRLSVTCDNALKLGAVKSV